MRFGLDGYPLVWPKTGIGHYTFELARALAELAPEHTFELIAPRPFPPAVVADVKSTPNLCTVSVDTNFVTRRWWAAGLPRYARRAGLDLFHGTNYEVPLWNRHRNVLVIHDLSVLVHPDKQNPNTARRARRRLPIMLRAAARFITPTEVVKHELCERFKINPDLIAVTPEAPREAFRPMLLSETAEVRRRLKVDSDFILFVGTIEPRKNLLTLLRAFAEVLHHTAHQPQLLIAGAPGWLGNDVDHFIAASDFGDRLRMTGYLDDNDLRALYSSCKLFVYPSLYEGFGLPPLEAMACGAPVIASRIAALIETLNASAHFVEPTDEIALAQAIVDLLESDGERQRLATMGLRHAATYSWERTARMTLDVYQNLLRVKA